jgi:hypothetical protein
MWKFDLNALASEGGAYQVQRFSIWLAPLYDNTHFNSKCKSVVRLVFRFEMWFWVSALNKTFGMGPQLHVGTPMVFWQYTINRLKHQAVSVHFVYGTMVPGASPSAECCIMCLWWPRPSHRLGFEPSRNFDEGKLDCYLRHA